MKGKMKDIKLLFFNILLTYLLLELCALVLIEIFSYTSIPGYRKIIVENKFPRLVYIDTSFGTWHLPNAFFYHVSEDVDVHSYYNSYGARDKERERYSSSLSGLLIGDSFSEGYGVDTSARLSGLLEKKLTERF